MKKQKKIKAVKFDAIMIRNKASKLPWTMQLFSSETQAWNYWEDTIERFNWSFFKGDFEIYIVSIEPLRIL